MNPAPRTASYLPLYAECLPVPDLFDIVQFITDTGLDAEEAAQLLSAAVEADFI
jgi:hypothetical protein